MLPATAALEPEGFESLFSGHPDGVFVYEVGAGVIRANTQLAEMSGYSEAELAALGVARLAPPQEFRVLAEETRRAAAGVTRRFRTKLLRKDRQVRPVDLTMIPVRDRHGVVVSVVGFARDLALLDDSIRVNDFDTGILRIAGRAAKLAGWSIDAETGVSHISDEMSRVLGRPVDDAQTWTDRLRRSPRPEAQLIGSRIRTALTAGEPIDVTVTLPDETGTSKHLRILGEPVHAEGRVVRVDGAMLDITDIVRRERDTARLEGLLTTTLDQMPAGIAFLDRHWTCTYINKTAAVFLGSTPGELVGRNLWEAFPEADDTEFGTAYRTAMSRRVRTHARGYYAPLDGWFEVTAYPIEDGLAIQLHDVTAEEDTQEQFRAAAERTRFMSELLDAARDAIMVVGLDHRISYWNRGAEEAYGWSSAEAQGRLIGELIYPDPADFEAHAAKVRAFGVHTSEQQHVRRDGRRIIADCRWQVVIGPDDAPMSIFLIQTDITDQRRAEEKRFRDQRMESIGTLAGGIAHDLNNVLTPVLMAAQLLAEDEQDERRRQLLRSIDIGATRGADMIRQLLAFARGEEGQREVFPMRAVLSEFGALAREATSPGVEVHLDVDSEVGFVNGDRTQLLQVLMNLLTNADDALAGSGGTVTVKAYSTAQNARDAENHVVVEVIDDGEGMDSDTLSRAFEPFFSTRGPGGGTGLGLATSLSIVRTHGGSLEVESTAGAGSRFVVTLPAAPQGTAHPASLDNASPHQRGAGALVAVVDDEPEVRDATARALEQSGYRTISAAGGAEVLELLSGATTPDLVVLDLTMPGMDGTRTAGGIGDRHPDLPILIISGMELAVGRRLADTLPNAGFLPKPFTADALLRAVMACLSAGGRSR